MSVVFPAPVPPLRDALAVPAIRTDTSLQALRAAVRDDLERNAIRSRSLPGEGVVDTDQVLAYVCGVGSPDVNEVVRARFPDGAAADAAVHATIAIFDERPFLWWLGEDDRPGDLGERLERHGLVDLDHIPGMAMDLADLADPADAPPPPELEISPVLDPDGIDAFHAVLAHGFPEDYVDAATELAIAASSRRQAAETGYREPDGLATRWLGRVDGRAVATTRLHTSAGVAGVYGVVTVDDARRNGYGEAMTRHALRAARARGHRIAVLQASSAGRGLYERIGFREVYGYELYEWRPPATDRGSGPDDPGS